MSIKTLKTNFSKSTFAVLLLSLFMSVSVAADNTKLDTLFLELKLSENETEARKIEEKIWLQWMKSGDVEIDML